MTTTDTTTIFPDAPKLFRKNFGRKSAVIHRVEHGYR
jgi:hypothetical protein